MNGAIKALWTDRGIAYVVFSLAAVAGNADNWCPPTRESRRRWVQKKTETEMSMRLALYSLLPLMLILLNCDLAFAQLSPEEAYQRLQERKKEREAEEKAAATQPAAPAAPHTSGIEVGKMLHTGWQALTDHRYGDAAATFDKVVKVDALDPNAYQGRGICKYELKQYKPADQDLQKACELSGPASKISRQLAIASAAAALLNDGAMRAAKVLRGIMEPMAANGTLDEELQNDLGIALSHSSAQAKKLPLFAEALKFYMEYDKKLAEQKKDGTGRWGTKWISKGSAEHDWSAYKEASSEADAAVSNWQHARLAAEHSYDHIVELHGMRLHSDAEVAQYTTEYNLALKTEAAAKKAMNKALEHMSSVQKPPFPDRIEFDWREPR
jgi:tetratricopeptide (TPR) repeat protein